MRAGGPLVVFIHGGGWVLCGLESHDEICRNLCADMDCVVVSVDYRLAPQHRFPAGADDCLAATRWAAASHAGELGADAARLALVGDSAGATLAIATALRCAAEGGPALRAIAPLYPAADLRAPSIHASRREFGTRRNYGMTPREMDLVHRQISARCRRRAAPLGLAAAGARPCRACRLACWSRLKSTRCATRARRWRVPSPPPA